MTRTSPSRRRQRSVRLTVAVAILLWATLAVLGSLPTGSSLLIGAGAVFSLLCGWAAARIAYSEVVQTRRAAAADRAAQARTFQTMFAERAEENTAFATAMTDKLIRRDREVQELQGTLRLSERRAADAEVRVQREAKRANDAQGRVSELEAALEIQQAQQIDELAAWEHDALTSELETVVDLLAWEERATSARETGRHEQRHA